MNFDPNKSPCRGCRKNQETAAPFDQGFKGCMYSCIELALHQNALTKAEKIGLPKPGVCSVCRRPCEDMFCGSCRERSASEIKSRIDPEPIPKTNFGPKKKAYREFKWFEIVKKARPGRCQYCNGIAEVGKPVLARHTAPAKGNYRYAHHECAEQAGSLAV